LVICEGFISIWNTGTWALWKVIELSKSRMVY